MTLLRHTIQVRPMEASVFSILPGTFLLHIPPLIALFERLAPRYAEAPQYSGAYKASLDMLTLIAWLTQQAASGLWIVDRDESQEDLISSYAAECIFARQFASFSCPACELEFSYLEGTIAEWELSEGNETCNGRRLICPGGHTVYAATEQMCIDFVHVDPKIDEEDIAPFRAALMATDDTLVIGAGADGRIIRLETIEFKQSWIVNCDKYLADPDRSAEDRAKAFRRREAFLSVLERSLLDGVVLYNNSIFRVLVDKASNQVILCEIE